MSRSHIARGGRRRRQQGAALVVGLVLLAIVTLLAIARINSASLQLMIAANSQYQERAFQAAETGIEQTLATGAFTVPKRDSESHQGVQISPSSPEKFSATLTADLEGLAQPATWGNSWNSFSAYHFVIHSSGTSLRDAQAVHVQGVARLSPYSPSLSGSGPLN